MNGTLVLNASYEPLRVVSWHRAVVLVLDGDAEVISESEEPVRSQYLWINKPSVVKLKHYVTLPWKAKIPLNRRTLSIRDNHQCQVSDCTRSGTTIDHIIPRSRKGKHEWTNVVLMCGKCNAKKADSLLSEIGWTLKKEPTIPRGQLIVGLLDVDPAWRPHLLPAE